MKKKQNDAKQISIAWKNKRDSNANEYIYLSSI